MKKTAHIPIPKLDTNQLITNKKSGILGFIIWVLGITLGIIMLLGIQNSTHGSLLYPLKKIWEAMELGLADNPEERATIALRQANERIRELEILAKPTETTTTTDNTDTTTTAETNSKMDSKTTKIELKIETKNTGIPGIITGTTSPGSNSNSDDDTSVTTNRSLISLNTDAIADTLSDYDDSLNYATYQIGKVLPESEAYTNLVSDLAETTILNKDTLDKVLPPVERISARTTKAATQTVKSIEDTTKWALQVLPDDLEVNVIKELKPTIPDVESVIDKLVAETDSNIIKNTADLVKTKPVDIKVSTGDVKVGSTKVKLPVKTGSVDTKVKDIVKVSDKKNDNDDHQEDSNNNESNNDNNNNDDSNNDDHDADKSITETVKSVIKKIL